MGADQRTFIRFIAGRSILCTPVLRAIQRVRQAGNDKPWCSGVALHQLGNSSLTVDHEEIGVVLL